MFFAEWQVFGFLFRSASFTSGAVILIVCVQRVFLMLEGHGGSKSDRVAADDFLRQVR